MAAGLSRTVTSCGRRRRRGNGGAQSRQHGLDSDVRLGSVIQMHDSYAPSSAEPLRRRCSDLIRPNSSGRQLLTVAAAD